MISRVKTAAPIGFEGSLIDVECDATKSLPALQIVGLGNKAIDEARERVRSAIVNSLLEFPKKRITINLAPAELPKDGTHYDLPIALAILCVSGQIMQKELNNCLFAGELGLDGDIKPIKGAINITQIAKDSKISKVFLPEENINQARLVPDIEIIGIKNLKQLYLHLKDEVIITPPDRVASANRNRANSPLLDEIKGQEQAKRALIIAAAGHHNILLSGTPGAGKTMLAKTLANLLPDLSPEEQIAATKIHSLAGKIKGEIIQQRPFRSPHHTASPVSIIGGGNKPKPGEISLAHTGVLFLDEIPEYSRSTLEALRQPLEDKKIDISRANDHLSYPADFMLIATMNPCPCGYFGDNKKECSCTSQQIIAYQKRLSGPLIDRIDLLVNVSRVPNESLLEDNSPNCSVHKSAQDAIQNAIFIQNQRYKSGVYYNSSLTNNGIKYFAKLTDESRKLLVDAAEKLHLTTRGYFKVIKVARTIADLEEKTEIEPGHICEALQFRSMNT